MDQYQSAEIDKLVGAIIAAQLTMVPASKDATNPFFHSKYADLPAVWEALSPFRENGIAITQSPMDSPDGYIVLDTQLTHVSGQWMRSRLKMRVAKDDPQGAGSALTYARRYALGCMTGLVTEEDDDGNLASMKPAAKPLPKGAEMLEKLEAKAMASSDSFVWKIKGKYLDVPIENIDGSYLAWYEKEGKLQDHLWAAKIELDKRDGKTVQGDGLGSGVAPVELPSQQVKDAPAPSIFDQSSAYADHETAINDAMTVEEAQRAWDDVTKDTRLGVQKTQLYGHYQRKVKALKGK